MPEGMAKTEYESVVSRTLKGEEILFSSPYDLNAQGKYVNGLFVVTDKNICVFEEEKPILILKISSIEKVYCGEYVGNAILEAFTNNTRRCIVRFSMCHIEKFSAAAELICDIIEKNQVKKYDSSHSDEKCCPKCGRPFLRGTTLCRHCSDKLGMIKRIWQLSRPCRPLYMILLVFFWITSIVTVVTPMLNKHLVNDVLVAASSSVGKLLTIVSLMLLASIITTVISALRDYISSKASNMLVRDLRNDIYTKIQKMPLRFVEEKKAGDLMQRINNDTQRIQSFVQDIAIMAVNEVFLFIAIAIITFSINYKMALLIFVPMPVSLYFVNKIRKSIRRRYGRQWRKMDVLTNRITDVLNGIKVVKVFGREDDEIDRFQQTAASVRDLTCKNEKYVYTVFPLIRFLMSFGSFLVLLYGGYCVINKSMTLGELVQFSSYGSYLYSKLEWFSNLPRHFMMATISSQRVFELLDKADEEIEAKDCEDKEINGNFEFNDVTFGYKSYRKVLRNINASVKKGEMIGLVGHSGAGKSTMINLIMRLYNPDRGKIILDGINLSDYDENSYKASLGVVLQESYLFSGTILSNIKYAAPNITLEECILAAKKANAHDFIMKLPDGYNTYVGEKGYKLSGGERQRISIARAIAANPKIIVFDEATASVDTETEMKIQQALSRVTEGKTVFAIAHRLSTLKNANRLIVIEDGRIAEEGTHSELLEKGGIYSSLLKAQQEMIAIDNTHIKEEKGEEEKWED